MLLCCGCSARPTPPVSRCSMSKKTQREDVPLKTSPAPPVSRCSMSKKTQREDVLVPQAPPHLSVDVPCQRKQRGRMYRCNKPRPTCQQLFHVKENTEGGCSAENKPRPTCQQMFHVKENTEGGCTAATSPASPVSRCSMPKQG